MNWLDFVDKHYTSLIVLAFFIVYCVGNVFYALAQRGKR